MPASQTRSIPSPLSFSPPPPFFSLPLLHTAILCVSEHLSIPASLFTDFLLPPVSIHFPLPLPSHDLLPRPRGLTQLWDTSCSFNDFAPRPRSAREIQLPFFNRENSHPYNASAKYVCVCVYLCANLHVSMYVVHKHFVLILIEHLRAAAFHRSLLHILKWIFKQFFFKFILAIRLVHQCGQCCCR